ncbi:xylosyltransferase [Acrasis kona]|uniref:protein xylosyltransferase n=1 Tax=Acrasis kona TaxID=1008807 RepID=A0AAW2ZFC9_9EUKA
MVFSVWIYNAKDTPKVTHTEVFTTAAATTIDVGGPSNQFEFSSDVLRCGYGISISTKKSECCVCPQHSTGDRCEHITSHDQTYKKMTECYAHWDGINSMIEKWQDMDRVGATSNSMKKYIERLTAWGNGRSTCKDSVITAVDDFFHSIAAKYGPFKQNDAIMLKALHEYNNDMLKTNDKIESNFFSSPTPQRGKILFVLLSHKNTDLLMHLISAIVHPNHYYVVCLSRQLTDDHYKKVKNFIEELRVSNVALLPESMLIEGAWSDVSLMYMDMISVLYAFRRGWKDWAFKVPLSEAHFPIKKISELSAYLTLKRQNVVISDHYATADDRVRTTQIHLDGLCRNLYGWKFNGDWIFQKYPGLNPPQGGSQWHIMSRDVIMYLLGGKGPIEYMFATKHAAVPDEMYYHTVVNSLQSSKTWDWVNNARSPLPTDSVRVVKRLFTFLEFSGPNAREITPDDFGAMATSHKYFARKVSSISVAKQMIALFKINE